MQSATQLQQEVSRLLCIQKTHHMTFFSYKNKYDGKDVVLVASGPTLEFYKPLKKAIHIGINKTFLSHVSLDYLFMQDYVAIHSYIDHLDEYRYRRIQKFFGLIPSVVEGHIFTAGIIPESLALKYHAKRYYVDTRIDYKEADFCYDISSRILADMGSTVFSALQFAFWTNPKRLFLVGCDCSNGYFDKTNSVTGNDHLITSWKKLAQFAKLYYPLTEIISLNPVQLKGVFCDHFTSQDLKK